MAHEFTSGVMYGKAAWHGLGTTLKDDDERRWSVEGTMRAAGMGANVHKFPLSVSRTSTTPEWIQGKMIPDRFAICREPAHSGAQWKYVATVGPTYEPLQELEMFEWFQPFLDAKQARFETAGRLREGRVVWVLASLCCDELEIRPGDVSKPYILLSSSHDGSMATRAGLSVVRTVCANTLASAHSLSNGSLIKVKHTKSQHDALAAVRDTMDLVRGELASTAEDLRRMAEAGISEKQLAKFACDVLGVQDGDQDISKTKQNQLQRIVELAVGGRGQGGKLTAYAAYQGLTEWLTHFRQKDAATRVESLWFGDSAAKSRKGFELAMSLAG